MIKVLLLSRYDRLSPSSRLRTYQYIPYLKSRGIDVEPNPLSSDKYLTNLYNSRPVDWLDVTRSYAERVLTLIKHRNHDLLWIEHELFPWFPAVWEVFFNDIGVPYIADYDDAVFHRYDRHPVKALRNLYAGKIDAVMRNASLVIAGNRYLADRAAVGGAKRTVILPTVVDFNRYAVGGSSKSGDVTIGWIGSPTTAKYIRVAEAALSAISNEGNIRLVMIGSFAAPLKGIDTTVLEWSEATEVRDIIKCDIGIMPLPDNPWTRGKCGYKLIQYMACGLPVVASRVGMNSEIVDHGKTGFLATTTKEWADALRKLRDDPKLRERMGRAGLECVKKKYILDVTAPKLAALMRSCRR